MGPNGAGKTTTVKMVHGLLPKSGGSLFVLEKDVEMEAPEVKSQIGVVSQENNLDRDLSVIQNLLTYARYFDIPKDEALGRAEELLKFFQLDNKKDAKLKTLSGGMLRRLAITRSLINNPRLLILDEPTTGLDPQARNMIWRRLMSLKKQGITMILTTHYMEEAERLCDRVAMMDKGKILMEGKPAELIKKEIGEDVIEIHLDESSFELTAGKISDMDVEFEQFGETIYIYTEDGAAVMQQVLAMPHTHVVHRRATLEDLFLRLAGRTLTV